MSLDECGGAIVYVYSGKHSRLRCVGFTLIELLVVVSIIALLVSILLPALNRARGAARFAVCATQMHAIGLAEILYSGDFTDHLTPGDHGDGQVMATYAQWNTPSGPLNHGHLLEGYLPIPTSDNGPEFVSCCQMA